MHLSFRRRRRSQKQEQGGGRDRELQGHNKKMAQVQVDTNRGPVYKNTGQIYTTIGQINPNKGLLYKYIQIGEKQILLTSILAQAIQQEKFNMETLLSTKNVLTSIALVHCNKWI